MKLVVKVAISIIALVLLYALTSLIISKNQSFVNYYFFKNSNLYKAKENNIFVKELGSYKIDNKNWVVFQSEFCYFKSYGFLQLFKYKKCYDDQFWIKMELKNNVGYEELSNYNISYNGESLISLFNDYNGYSIKVGDSLKIEIFNNKDSLLGKTTIFLTE